MRVSPLSRPIVPAPAACDNWCRNYAGEEERIMPRAAIEYRDASAEVCAVFDDIKRTRRLDDVNNFWKYLAHDPALLKRTWESIK
jgi:hypothetical protein